MSGGAYQSILKRIDAFLEEPIAKALKERERRGKKILKLDDAVTAVVDKLKAKGLTSPYLKAFVVSRVNYTRFVKSTDDRLRRGRRQDHGQRAEVQRREGEAGRRRESGWRTGQTRSDTQALLLMDAIAVVADRLRRARRITALTGAGVSAASGIPTFRGPDGLWKKVRAETLATPEAFEHDPKLVWEWYDWRRGMIASARPNAAHEVLARWTRERPDFTLITQNVDGLHERASEELARRRSGAGHRGPASDGDRGSGGRSPPAWIWRAPNGCCACTDRSGTCAAGIAARRDERTGATIPCRCLACRRRVLTAAPSSGPASSGSANRSTPTSSPPLPPRRRAAMSS